MIRSMTGFGEATTDLPQGQLRATVKTVNHRFFNAHMRTPYGFDRFEAAIQTALKGFFSRGHVNLTLVLEKPREVGAEAFPELDMERVRHQEKLLSTLAEELGVPLRADLAAILRQGDLLVSPEAAAVEEGIEVASVRAIVEEAARAALAMREEEGARLAEDLRERLAAMDQGLAVVEQRAPERLLVERDRLRASIRELSEREEVDEDRLAKEVAYLAERWDINEEIVRFRAHLKAFRQTLAEAGGEPVGKRLGFLVQEMHREANTIASKANDLDIGHASVSIREEIEKLREQLENVE